MIDPGEFIITRKRKKYKFALFANSSICFELDQWQKKKIDIVEIGAGTGLFSAKLAIKYPEKIFLAVDVKGDRLQKGARYAEEMGLTNIYFLRARADQLVEIIDEKTLSDIWITFPDPYPKKRSSGRRLTHVHFLDMYSKLLGSGGVLQVKHDNLDFFCWSLEQLIARHFYFKALTFDLHDSDLAGPEKIMTTYENKWINEGRKINFVRASLSD